MAQFHVDEHLIGETRQVVELRVTGRTIEEIHIAAHAALTALIPDRPFSIDSLIVAPLLVNDGGGNRLWEAHVNASLPPFAPAVNT